MTVTPLERAITAWLRSTPLEDHSYRAQHIVRNILAEYGYAPPREGETKIELIKLDGIDMIVITNPDGTSKHVKIATWVEGQPRPTEPGVFLDATAPTEIYTLYGNGSWKHNRQISNNWLDSGHIPDNLIKIA